MHGGVAIECGGWSRSKMCDAKPSCKNFDQASRDRHLFACLESFLN